MKHLVWVAALLLFSVGNGAALAQQETVSTKVEKKQENDKKQLRQVNKGKKRLTKKETMALQKKAERDLVQHETETRRREYQQKQEAQRRGMQMQQMQHQVEPEKR